METIYFTGHGQGWRDNFSRFAKQLPISQKVLSQNLKVLERDGLVFRDVIPETPPRTEYRLTQRGQAVIPLLDQLYAWGRTAMQKEGLPIDALGEMWHGFRMPGGSKNVCSLCAGERIVTFGKLPYLSVGYRLECAFFPKVKKYVMVKSPMNNNM